MDMTVQLSRTIKGQEEIFNHGHTVRPKCRQILFAIGNGITFGALRDKLANPELETLLNDLQRGGFIEVEGATTVDPPHPSSLRTTRFLRQQIPPLPQLARLQAVWKPHATMCWASSRPWREPSPRPTAK